MTALPGKLTVLIADDHEMVADMFALYLSAVADMQVQTARTLDEALARIAADGPFDVVLLDLNMPGMAGVATVARVVDANAGRPVAVLTGGAVAHMVEDLLAAGAAGIVLKSTPVGSLGAAIQQIHSGQRYMPPDLEQALRKRADTGQGRLSEREMTVMSLLAEGRQNKEIAHLLNLAEPTIKMHVQSICRKLGAGNRTHAVIVAHERGLL